MTLTQFLVPIEIREIRHDFTIWNRSHAVKRSKYTEEQIAFALKQAELGTAVPEVCRKMGVSEATFYN